MNHGRAAWADALLAARLFAAAPHRLGGIRLRARPGPVRDRWLSMLATELCAREVSLRTLPAAIDLDRLLGGLDLAATLARGRRVAQAGVLAQADGGVVIVPMAERMAPHVTTALIAALDTAEVIAERDGLSLRSPARIGVVLIDEGEDGEAPPAAIVERVALACSLEGVSVHDLDEEVYEPSADSVAEECAETLCRIGQALGIESARAVILALATARASARQAGRDQPNEGDLEIATRLCLLPRATRLPDPTEADEQEQSDTQSEGADGETGVLADRVVEAALARLPADVLAGLDRATAKSRQSGRGSGAARKSPTRGRPIGARAGKPGSSARLHLVETLRAAAPWQKLRRGGDGRVRIRASDFRVRRFAERSEATLIFAIDTSGSASAERMAETKGAIELLLAEAYVKRTQVALVGFRGVGAEVLLPPTRSLVRAKRQLADMAGGGGTPLAAGIDAAHLLAEDARARGRAPFIVLMTDGRANVAHDGRTGRAAGNADAAAAARRLAVSGIKAVVIDVAARPRDDARALAAAMAADYAALPRADARALSGLVGALAA